MPWQIVMHILLHGQSSFNQLHAEVRCAKSTLSYHLARMVNREILSVQKLEKESWYDIRDATATADLLIALRESMECDAVDRFVQLWEELGRSG